MLTGGTSGVYYPLGVALSNVIGKAMPGAKTSVQATKASVENLNLLQAGRGEIAFTLGDSLSDAWKGNEDAGFKTPLKKLRGIAAIYPNYIQIVARADSGIKTLADLKGKKISVGAPKSGTELNARAIFAAAGITYKDFAKVEYLPFGESVELMKNRQIDITLQSAGLGVSALRDLATSVDIVVVPIPADIVKKTNDPAYMPAMIPANTYRGQTADVPAAAVQNYLVTHDGVSNDTVYAMTKALWTNLDQLDRRAFGREGDRSQEGARGHAGAAASGRREVLQGSGRPEVSAGHPEPAAAGARELAHPEEAAFDETGVKRELTGWPARLIAAVALAFSAYQLVVAAYAPLSSLPTRSIHVGFLLALAFLIHPVAGWADRHRIAWYDALLAAVAFALALYHLVFEADLDPALGRSRACADLVGRRASFIVLVFEAARRVLGIALPIICATFLAYGLFGQYLPGVARAPRLRLRPDRRPALPRHRGHLRHPDARVGDVHLPVHPVRQLPRARRHDQPVQQHRARLRRPRARRSGEGRGDLVGHDGHDLRLGRGQRADRRPVHDPADEALRLFAGVRRRGRGDREHGRPDHAAGDGRGRLHHGRDAQRAVRHHRQGRGRPRDPVLRDRVLDGAPRGRARAACTGCRSPSAPIPWQAIRQKWYLMLPLAVLVFMLFDGFTPMFSGLVGLALTPILILGVGRCRAHRPDGVPLRVLDRARRRPRGVPALRLRRTTGSRRSSA